MKQKNIQLLITTLVVLLSGLLNPALVRAQGSLTPPGAPAPTMKSLAQIEPRTPISSAPFTINASGSYYLTTNLTTTVSNAIVITANGVTLDLSGFTLFSTVTNANNGGYAILLAGSLSDITILNGYIRGGVTNNGSGSYSGSGFGYGIYYSPNAPVNTRVYNVSVTGCLFMGISIANQGSTLVESCTVRTVNTYGILAATIKNSTATDCGLDAIVGNQVSDCRGEVTASLATGVSASTALNCFGSSTSGTGLNAVTAQNCYGVSVSSTGLSASTAQNCYGSSSTGTALNATVAIGCYCASSSGLDLSANIANSCYAPSNSVVHKYNMP
jgi:hypothetical protein